MFRSDSVGEDQGLFQAEVRMVFLVTHRVESQMPEPLEFLQFAFFQAAHVSDVGNVSESETEHRKLVVQASDRNDPGPLLRTAIRRRSLSLDHFRDAFAGRDQRTVRKTVAVADIVDPDQLFRIVVRLHDERFLSDDVHVPFRGSGILRKGEDIGIFPDQVAQDILFAVDFGRTPVDIVQRTHVVQSAGVVFVIVRQKNGIQMMHFLREHLHPEIRTCVHKDVQPGIFDKRRCPEPLVPGVRRAADRTVASDDRNAL